MMHCWSVVDDLKDLSTYCGKNNSSSAEILQVVQALATVYQLKFELMFETFEAMLHEQHVEKCAHTAKVAF